MTEEGVSDVINHTVEFTESHSTGLIAFLQRFPFFRVIYSSLKNGLLKRILPEIYSTSAASETSNTDSTVDYDALETYFKYISNVGEKYGTKIIIVYHQKETIDEEGNLVFGDKTNSDAFADYASKYGVYYIDLRDAFLEEYETNHHVPHGFETGELCKGHLNRYGHRIFAQQVADLIYKIEEADV